MKRMRQIWLAGLVLLSLSAEVSAQSNVAMQDSIPEIVVTGTGTEHYLKDAPVPEVQGRFRVGRHFRDESRQDLFDGRRISGDDRQDQGEPVNITEHFPWDYIE